MDQEKIQQFRDQQAQQADVAKQDGQHEEITSSLNNLLLATMVSKDPKMVEVAQNLAELLGKIGEASESFGGSSLHLLPIANAELATAVMELTNRIDQSPDNLAPYFDELSRQIAQIADYRPVVNVPKQPVTVDLNPLIKGLDELKKEVSKNKVDIDIPKTDMSDVIKGLKDVQKTIGGLSFPVPNYVLPFSQDGKATQVVLDSSGNVPVSGSFTPSGTQDVNVEQLNNTTIDTNSGVKSAGTQRVVLATDQPQLTNPLKVDGSATTQPVSGTGTFTTKETQPDTPTLANVTMTGSSVTLQASNTARRNLMIFNDSGVTVYVKLGSSASSTSFTVKMVDQAYYELPNPVYTGIVSALGTSGDVRVTEVV